MFRHCIKRCAQPSPLSFFKFAINTLFLSFLLIAFTPSFAEKTYGPIKKGQSLWEIAEKILPANSVTIEQLVFSLYETNQAAFQSGNMNLLKAGSYITIPSIETTLKVSQKDAKQQLSQHTHALNLIRVDALQLKKIEKKKSKYSKQVKRYQKRLAKYKYESHAWNRTYKSLVKAKRRFKKSRKKTVKLRKLLLEKAALKFSKKNKTRSTDSVKIRNLATQIDQVNIKFGSLQSSQKDISSKVESVEAMEQRIDILENELGSTDTLVSKLKLTVTNLQENIGEQESISEKLQENINIQVSATKKRQEDMNKQASVTKKLQESVNTQASITKKLQEEISEQAPINKKIQEDIYENTSVTGKLLEDMNKQASATEKLQESVNTQASITKKLQADISKISINKHSDESKNNNATQTSQVLNEEDSIHISALNISSKDQGNNEADNIEALRITLTSVEQADFEFIKQEESNQPSLSPISTIKQDYNLSEYSSVDLKHASLSQIEPNDKALKLITTSNKNVTEHTEPSITAPKKERSYFSKLIIIGSILNGIILFFVLFKIILNRQTKTLSV